MGPVRRGALELTVVRHPGDFTVVVEVPHLPCADYISVAYTDYREKLQPTIVQRLYDFWITIDNLLYWASYDFTVNIECGRYHRDTFYEVLQFLPGRK